MKTRVSVFQYIQEKIETVYFANIFTKVLDRAFADYPVSGIIY